MACHTAKHINKARRKAGLFLSAAANFLLGVAWLTAATITAALCDRNRQGSAVGGAIIVGYGERIGISAFFESRRNGRAVAHG